MAELFPPQLQQALEACERTGPIQGVLSLNKAEGTIELTFLQPMHQISMRAEDAEKMALALFHFAMQLQEAQSDAH